MIQKRIIKAILDVLFLCDGHPLAEETLFIETNVKLDAMAVSSDELKNHLIHCSSKGWIDFIVDEIDSSKRWFITQSGKVVRS